VSRTLGTSVTVSKAVVRAAVHLQLSQFVLARVLQLNRQSTTALLQGDYVLQTAAPEFELAVLFLRLFRALQSVVGLGEPATRWLHGINSAFNATPLDLICDREGMVIVTEYLEAHESRQ
jgi:hypothetical protein